MTTLNHVEESIWERLAIDNLTAEERAQAFDHITRCTTCRDTYRGIQLLKKEAVGGQKPPQKANHYWALAAVAAALIMAVVLVLPNRTAIDPSATRSGFEWEAMSGADSYRIRLFSEDGTLLWESENVTVVSMEWPEVIERTRGNYYWQVLGYRGTELVREGNLIPFQIR